MRRYYPHFICQEYETWGGAVASEGQTQDPNQILWFKFNMFLLSRTLWFMVFNVLSHTLILWIFPIFLWRKYESHFTARQIHFLKAMFFFCRNQESSHWDLKEGILSPFLNYLFNKLYPYYLSNSHYSPKDSLYFYSTLPTGSIKNPHPFFFCY